MMHCKQTRNDALGGVLCLKWIDSELKYADLTNVLLINHCFSDSGSRLNVVKSSTAIIVYMFIIVSNVMRLTLDKVIPDGSVKSNPSVIK